MFSKTTYLQVQMTDGDRKCGGADEGERDHSNCLVIDRLLSGALEELVCIRHDRSLRILKAVPAGPASIQSRVQLCSWRKACFVSSSSSSLLLCNFSIIIIIIIITTTTTIIIITTTIFIILDTQGIAVQMPH